MISTSGSGQRIPNHIDITIDGEAGGGQTGVECASLLALCIPRACERVSLHSFPLRKAAWLTGTSNPESRRNQRSRSPGHLESGITLQ